MWRKFFPENSIMNTAVPLLSYSCMFQVKICSQQLEICKSMCMFCSDDCRSWPCEEKINNHGFWGKQAHIPDNDYWGICLFHIVWTNVVFVIILMWYTQNIYIFSSTEHCAWAIISAKEFKSWVTRISFALLYRTGQQNYLLSNILRFALKICVSADF